MYLCVQKKRTEKGQLPVVRRSSEDRGSVWFGSLRMGRGHNGVGEEKSKAPSIATIEEDVEQEDIVVVTLVMSMRKGNSKNETLK